MHAAMATSAPSAVDLQELNSHACLEELAKASASIKDDKETFTLEGSEGKFLFVSIFNASSLLEEEGNILIKPDNKHTTPTVTVINIEEKNSIWKSHAQKVLAHPTPAQAYALIHSSVAQKSYLLIISKSRVLIFHYPTGYKTPGTISIISFDSERKDHIQAFIDFIHYLAKAVEDHEVKSTSEETDLTDSDSSCSDPLKEQH